MSGDTTYGATSCDVVSCDCEFLGQTIANGDSLTVYTNTTDCVACTDGLVSCDTGVLSGDTSYGATSCDVVSCDCEFLGETINDGDSLTVYTTATDCVACTDGSVSCDTGVLSGDTTYGYTSCSVISCGQSGIVAKSAIVNIFN